MKIVLDTNVIISAFLWVGQSNKILDCIEKRKILVYSCPEQIIELEGVLARPKFQPIFHKTSLKAGLIVSTFLRMVRLVEPVSGLKVIKEDRTDNIILSCALTAKATYLITGDNHLLSLKKFQGIKIIKPRQFLEKF